MSEPEGIERTRKRTGYRGGKVEENLGEDQLKESCCDWVYEFVDTS